MVMWRALFWGLGLGFGVWAVGNPVANLESISQRCYLFEVAFVWELTKETIHLHLGCLQGGPQKQQPESGVEPMNPQPSIEALNVKPYISIPTLYTHTLSPQPLHPKHERL